MGALFWDRRRPRLPGQLRAFPWRQVQARTPAVPEERAYYWQGVTKGRLGSTTVTV